jgi:hypothetical protein
MKFEGAVELLRKMERDSPLTAGKRLRLPSDTAEASWAALHCDPFARLEPVLRSGLLQMTDIGIALFIAEQPAKAESGLQDRVHDS